MGEKLIATNRQAHRDYEIFESMECGIELKGAEVKSLRGGNANLKDSFARIEGGQVLVYNIHISPYQQASTFNESPTRVRRLLLHKKEIMRLAGKLTQKGLTLVPLRMYFKKGFAKLEVAIARGKRLYDKRDAIKRKELEREMGKVMKFRRKG